MFPSGFPTQLQAIQGEDFESGLLHKQLWLAEPGVTTHAHYDIFDNFYTQLRGRKQFFLGGPEQRAALHLFPVTHEQTRQSRFNFSSSTRDNINFPTRATGAEVILAPGEVLFIPAYTFHQVHPITFSASVNVFSEFSSRAFSNVFTAVRSAGIPNELQQLDGTVDGSRRRVAVLAHLVRSLLQQAWGYSTHDAVRRFIVAELSPRYRGLPTPAGCDVASGAEAGRCPAGPLLGSGDLAEVAAAGVAIASALHAHHPRMGKNKEGDAYNVPNTRKKSSRTSNTSSSSIDEEGEDDGAPSKGSPNDGPDHKEEYTRSVLHLLTANYIEDLAAGVLGAEKVCLYLKCLVTPGAWP
jgi:hypothetical protein